MVKRDGHIDLVFRDGLKNLEVLPPSDIWINVSGEIAPVSGKAWVFRIAAGIAAMVSLGLLAYLVGIRSTNDLLSPLATEVQSNPVISNRPAPDNAPVLAEAIVVDNAGSELESVANNEVILARTDDDSQGTIGKPAIYNTGFMLSDKPDVDIVKKTSQAPDQILSDVTDENVAGSLIGIDYKSDKFKNREKWMLGAKISPTYLSANLKAANNDFNELSGDETAALSYSGGVSVSYSVGGRLSLQTGLFYSSLGRQISDINSYRGYADFSDSKGGKLFGVETSSGVIASTNSDFFLMDASNDRISSLYATDNFDPVKASLDPYGNSLEQSFEYIEIPFMLSYKLVDRRVDFNIMGGMSYGFLLNNSVYAVSGGSKTSIGSTEDITSLLLSSALGMSMQYSISDRFSLNFEPSFRYFLNADGRLTANNPYTFGFFSGVYYKF